MKPQAWGGALSLGDGWAVWRGGVGDNAVHRHLAAQAVSSEEPLGVEDATGQLHRGRLVLIDPLVPHRLTPARRADIVFLEPLGVFTPPEILAAIRADGVEPIRLEASATGLQFWRSWENAAPLSSAVSNAAIRASLTAVEDALGDGPVTLRAAAATAGLSAERYRHLFVTSMGLPFRRYVLWRRLQRGVAALQRGDAVTTAAYEAGFADSAHFARTVRAMLGVRASQLLPEPH